MADTPDSPQAPEQERYAFGRRVVRLIASALAAGGVAFGSTVAVAFSDGGTLTETTSWLILGAVVAAMCKDIQASLSSPPERRGPNA
jgi:hypothetical protein